MDGPMQSWEAAPRLLVVEDDEDYRLILRRVLEPLAHERGWEALFLGAVSEGEAVLERTSVDLLVSDYNLHDGLGTILTRSAQQIDPEPHHVILTSDPVAVRELWRDEPDIVDEIWEKPWDPRAVALRISACMDAVEHAAFGGRATRS